MLHGIAALVLPPIRGSVLQRLLKGHVRLLLDGFAEGLEELPSVSIARSHLLKVVMCLAVSEAEHLRTRTYTHAPTPHSSPPFVPRQGVPGQQRQTHADE